MDANTGRPKPEILQLVVGYRGGCRIPVHIGEVYEKVVAVDSGLRGYAAHTEAVVLSRDEAGDRGAVVLEGVVDVGPVGVIVVIEVG